MKVLVIIKTPPVSQVVHEIAIETVEKLSQTGFIDISGVFFTDNSVSIASKGINQISSLEEIQLGYINLKKEKNIPLYVCGRAYKEQGLDKSSLDKEFTLSGNMELSMMMCSVDKIMEF